MRGIPTGELLLLQRSGLAQHIAVANAASMVLSLAEGAVWLRQVASWGAHRKAALCWKSTPLGTEAAGTASGSHGKGLTRRFRGSRLGHRLLW